MDLAQFVAAIVTGILAALVTIYLTPKVQHHFWKAQRLTDLRFATITEVNRLFSDYLTGHIARDTGRDPSWMPTRDFFLSLRVATAEVKALFSEKSWKAFKDVEVLITAEGGIGPSQEGKGDHDFAAAHEKAMRTFYEEIGLQLPRSAP